MTATVTLLYEAVAFDLNYYLTSHMPLVDKTWKSKGLKRWVISELDPTTGYSTQCSMEWESGAAFMKAAKEDHDLIMGDIPNYTTGKLTTIIGKIVGGS